MERDFKWVWIPKEIWLSNDINIMCKILLVEIDSLSKTEDWCYAWNEYFAEFLWISTTQVSKYISLLKEKGYVIEVSFDWRKRILKSCLEVKLKADFNNNWNQPLRKIKSRIKENLKYININNNINNNILNNNSSEAENSNETPLLNIDIQEEKEKSSAKKEKESYGREDINYLIEQIKLECNNLWVMYDKTKEREFSKHILTAKEFWENAEKCWMNRINFALNILLASIKIKYWKWVCSWPMKIYQNYSDVYNRTLLESKKKQEKSKVAFIPWIYQDDKN